MHLQFLPPASWGTPAVTCNTVKPNLLSPAIKRKGPRANATVDFAVPFTGVSGNLSAVEKRGRLKLLHLSHNLLHYLKILPSGHRCSKRTALSRHQLSCSDCRSSWDKAPGLPPQPVSVPSSRGHSLPTRPKPRAHLGLIWDSNTMS